MKQSLAWFTAFLLFSVPLAGCQNEEQPEAAQTPVQPANAEQVSAPGAPAENAAPDDVQVPIQLADWEEVERLVADQRGKVVVLDVWSTWCLPCIREFPNLVALHQKHGDAVACMSLSCNYTGAEGEAPDDARPEIEAFLRQQRATFTNVLSTTPDEKLFELLGAASVPVVRVYDKQGQLRKQFMNDDAEYGEEGFSYEQHIAPLVAQLLNE